MRPFCLLVLVLVLQEANCSQKQQKLYDFKTKLHQHSSLSFQISSSSDLVKSSGRVFYPIGYGADPSGVQDSTAAVMDAVSDACSVGNGQQLLPGVNDLGGAIVDLQGGSFRVSKPIVIPPNSGNLVIQGGTLRASNTFPPDGYLIELHSPSSLKSSKTTANKSHDTLSDMKTRNEPIYYEDITFRDILFDSSNIGGGLRVVDSARTRVNNCFFLHFVTEGILVERGHETFISSCFMGEIPTIGGDQHERDFMGTAIDLASNDNAVTDVVIFSAAIGMVLRGQANMITGVHCYNKATFFGGIGILIKTGQIRIDNSYMDYNSIVIEDPSQVHITNGFFLGGGNIVLKSVNGRISGLNIINNMFTGDSRSVVELDGEFTSIDQVVIDQNNVKGGMRMKSTVGKLAVTGSGTVWMADFSPVLIFPDRISHVQYSVYNSALRINGMGGHAVTNVSGNIVVVETEKQMNGTVWFLVDQNP
ncbi:putative endo-polygalacturonase [Helianthus annuus]|nr:putative endo-polygalacturonase [Helianthus annuus]KAJ0656018.1 putative endo-polygalacturonase [Helianthus annuus]KAJ0703361.1 putative endo-polygalacturonase [Helianthus annuus]KAJ0840059.1 putative polygalacturonase [Helianthus annuus]